MSQWFQYLAADFDDTGNKSWYHGMTKVSIPEVNMLNNSPTLAVSVQINFSTKLGFVSLNGPRETFFVDALRISNVVQYFVFRKLITWRSAGFCMQLFLELHYSCATHFYQCILTVGRGFCFVFLFCIVHSFYFM